MGQHRGPAGGDVRLSERGSAIIDGAVALAIAFVLLTVIVQAAFTVVARNSAETAVAASARRAALPGVDLEEIERSLEDLLATTLPGASELDVAVVLDDGEARAGASFAWDGPGPAWLPVTIRVDAAAPAVTAP